jgi:hypothetical protein
LKTTVFAGPTLAAAEVRALLPDAQVHGPAELGSVYRSVLASSTTIAIIDGYFEHRLPVWHKEILWALSRGVRVYGAASMGALRAAELADFGMTGVGQIFEWFRDGTLEDDDEVAVVHDERNGRYRARSDAMVNVRATLSSAREQGVLSPEQVQGLLTVVKSAPYPRRDLRHAAQEFGLDAAARDAFLSWLELGGMRDLKREDALALLRRLAIEPPSAPAVTPRFCFAYTEAWHELVRTEERAARMPPGNAAETDESLADLFEEVQLGEAEQLRTLWADATRMARSRGSVGSGIGAAPSHYEILACLPDVLTAQGRYSALAARAADKSARLASAGRPTVSLVREDLVRWHFERLSQAVPSDLVAHARALAFEELEDFIVAIAREHWYLTQLRQLHELAR